MTTSAPGVGIRRSIELFRLYRREPVEPEAFYEFLAADTMSQLAAVGAQLGLVVDIGGGAGYIADSVRARGGRPVVVEYNEGELRLHGRTPTDAIVGDGQALPLRTAFADVAHCSNVLEHVPHPTSLLSEMARVLRPGGIGYLSYTPWFSPWGGHETSPWHYLGGGRAARRYEGKHGRRPKNEFGESLYELKMRTVRNWFSTKPGIDVVWAGPRYWPPSWRALASIPFVGEFVTWNHLMIFRKREA